MSEPTVTHASGPLLEVTDLATYFETSRGLVRAVEGVSLTLDRGKTLGIVGESGSGKTVLSRSIMNLLPKSDGGTSQNDTQDKWHPNLCHT